MDKLRLLRRLLDVSEEIISNSFEEYIIKPLIDLRDSPGVKYSDFVKSESMFTYVVDMIIRKAFRLSKGVWHLCNKGYGDVGVGAVRTLIELCIDVDYIKQDKNINGK